MSATDLRNRISKGAAVLMVLLSGYLVYYAYNSFHRAYRFSFGERERWNNVYGVESDAVIQESTRWAYFGLWAAAILTSILSIIAGLYLLNRCRKGLLFDEPTAKALQWVGATSVFAMLVDTVFGYFDRYLLTLHNQENRIDPQFLYDPTDIKMICVGCVIFLFGWVAREGIAVENENKEYV